MGTNYYLIENPCDKCGRGDNKLHIGRSSAGWAFILRLHPEYGIESLEHWIRRFVQNDARIEDEYGHLQTIDGMMNNIFRGTTAYRPRNLEEGFLASNHAMLDSRNLLRRLPADTSLAYDTCDTDFS